MTVNHNILLYKLYNYGIRGVVRDWFTNYLSNRQQYTCVNGINSSLTILTCGVPQGSVLGPLLFLIYVNDIGNAGLKVPVKLFADGINLFIFGKNVSDVENQTVHSISLLIDWFVSNKLSLNLAKFGWNQCSSFSCYTTQMQVTAMSPLSCQGPKSKGTKTSGHQNNTPMVAFDLQDVTSY